MEEEKTPVTSPNTLRETEPAKDYPNTLFAIFLGVFFCLLFRASIASIRQFAGDIIPGIRSSENPTIFIAYYAIYVLWLAFGFWSVILALKSSSPTTLPTSYSRHTQTPIRSSPAIKPCTSLPA